MIKRILFMFAVAGIAFVSANTAFGQNGTRSKPKPKPFIGDTLDGVGIRKKPARKVKAAKNRRTNRSRRAVSKRRPTRPVRNLDSDNGGMTTADELPEIGRRRPTPTNTQSNVLPYIEPGPLTKTPKTRKQPTRRRTASRKKN